MTVTPDTIPSRLRVTPWAGMRRPGHVIERNVIHYRRRWSVLISGALEPLSYLLSAQVGIGTLVGGLPAPDGRLVSYAAFVGPALLASSAANGVIYDTTFNFFEKLRHARAYDAMLATPMGVRDISLGELVWALVRGSVHSLLFVATMLALGLLESWWAVLALPAVMLVSWGFAGLGLAVTTYVRTWHDFEWQQLIWMPMFLLSASFFPLSVYPDWLQWVVRATPLYQGVAMERALVLGGVGWETVGHALYLAVMGWFCLRHATKRMARLLLR